METHNSTLAYTTSDRTEYQLSNDLTDVTLLFPSTLDQQLSRLRGRCLRIDHVILEYRNQVPINATGHVIIEMHDTRLGDGDSKQAEFTIPIGCNCNIHYYSSSYFSPKDPNPWRVMYRVDNTNVINGVHFCRIQGKLRMSSAKQSSDIQFRSPRIDILSKAYNNTHIDFWTVGQTQAQFARRPVMGLRSASARFQRPTIGPGETWASASSIDGPSVADYPYRALNRLDPASLDPGPSASQVNNNVISAGHSNVNDDVINIIKKTVELCMSSNNVTSNAKPV
ncbi:BC1 protein [Clerodendrum golden mosaic China virus]|uniref:Movement protein BC1 n=1 Tax=Clerodendrum golden mosaic China virus TaxID=559878 RepID=C5J9H8_9GEMI|nr:BC1 protein [Clerodendrum golden mosaic China virus]